jgi:hypothetical protein
MSKLFVGQTKSLKSGVGGIRTLVQLTSLRNSFTGLVHFSKQTK